MTITTGARRVTDADRAAQAAERRDAYIHGLRALEVLLGTHADIPLPSMGTDYYADGGDEEKIAEVDRIAVALRVRAGWQRSHYIAELPLGGGVIYRAVAVPAAAARSAA